LLSDEKPVSTGGFPSAVISACLPPALLSFLPASRFLDDIITIKKHAESIQQRTRTIDDPSQRAF
ncbi:hypothetical protein T01_10458, partial [Trichinella spiralis]